MEEEERFELSDASKDASGLAVHHNQPLCHSSLLE